MRRNRDENASVNDRFPAYQKSNSQEIYIKGNPDYSAVQTVMIGIRNPRSPDRQAKNIKIWANELRLTGFNKDPGSAARASVNLQLADFATISANGKYSTSGFGGLEQQISTRRLETNVQYGANSNISLHRFFPKEWGLNLPLNLSYSREDIIPKFDPLNPDVETSKSVQSIEDGEERREYRRLIQDNTIRRSISMNNIGKRKTNPNAKNHLWDVENISLSAGYSDVRRTNKNTQMYFQKNYQGGVGYNYSFNSNDIENGGV